MATQDLYVEWEDLAPPRAHPREWRRWAAPALALLPPKVAAVATALRWTRGRAPRARSFRTLRREGIGLRR